MIPYIYAFFIVLIALGLFSLVPASRGSGCALFVAVPLVLIGGILTWSIFTDEHRESLQFGFLYPSPLIVGVASIALWVWRRNSWKKRP